MTTYQKIENAIIKWNNDGTKTAGELTREIMEIIKQPAPKQATITKEDIETVIEEIWEKGFFTDKEIEKVIELYPSEVEADPTGYWALCVENLLYQTIDARKVGGL